MSKSISTQNAELSPLRAGENSWLSIHEDRIRFAAYFAIAATAVAYAFHLYTHTRVGLTNGQRVPLGFDFINYWSSSALAWQGLAAEIYDWDRYHKFVESIAGAPLKLFHYSYSPAVLILTLPFAALPYLPALAVWLASSWYAFYRALRLALPGDAGVLLALAAPAVFLNTLGGQNGFWTAAFMGGGLCLLQRAPVFAGILFGLLLYKPHLAVLIPVALIAGRQWRAFAAAAATVVFLLAASVLAFGPELWAAYFDRVAALRVLVLENGYGTAHWMISIFVAARTLGADPHVAYLIQICAALMAGAVVALAWWRDAPAPLRYSLLVLGNFLATPYLQDYDLVVGTFVAAWLVGYCTTQRLPDKTACIAAFLLLILPVAATPFGTITGISPGPLVLIPVFIFTARLMPDLFVLPPLRRQSLPR